MIEVLYKVIVISFIAFILGFTLEPFIGAWFELIGIALLLVWQRYKGVKPSTPDPDLASFNADIHTETARPVEINRPRKTLTSPREIGPRLSYQESSQKLFGEEAPAMPDQKPQYDSEPKGIEFFRCKVGDEMDLGHLTLSRTFVCRSELNGVSCFNSDFSESNMCWNDFIDVDFTHASLANCDLRASLFENTLFISANLSGADLRQSGFTDCDFTDAKMTSTVLTHEQGAMLELSEEQIIEIAWTEDAGEEPEGG